MSYVLTLLKYKLVRRGLPSRLRSINKISTMIYTPETLSLRQEYSLGMSICSTKSVLKQAATFWSEE